MSTTRPMDLEEAIRQAGEGWLIDWFEPSAEAINHLRKTIDAVNQQAQARLGSDAPDLSEIALLEEYSRNPSRLRAFFQALGARLTPDILLMTWRIMQGLEINRVEVDYLARESFQLRVVLEAPDGGDETYDSSDIGDFKVFRHMGILKLGDSPVLEGFYPRRAVN